jgi:hypothetical protein
MGRTEGRKFLPSPAKALHFREKTFSQAGNITHGITKG